MSVWLTPDLKPVVGGTYFPPDDRYHGRPGFSSILNYIAEKARAAKKIFFFILSFCFVFLVER